MTKTLLPLLSIMMLLAVITVGQATDAFAELSVKLSSDGDMVTVVDNDVMDNNGNVGATSTDAFVGNFDFVMTAAGLSKPTFGGMLMPDIDTFLITTNTGAGGTLLFEVTDTDFTGTVLECRTEGGGTTDGTVEFSVYFDSLNQPFGKEGQVLTIFSDPADGDINFSVDLTGSLQPDGPFSLTTVSEVVHSGAPEQTSYDIRTRCEPVVAGESLAISTPSLMLGGLGMSLTWLVPVMASIGGAAAYIQYRRN